MTGARTAIVGVLVAGSIAAVLIGWYRAGMREVAREQEALVEGARRDVAARAAEHADALAAQLEALRVAESARPYFHYQNLFHDPAGASEGLAVVPSPLASGTAAPLIAVHFQIDERGAVTSPSVNDVVPEAVQSRSPDRSGLARVAEARVALAEAAVGGEVAVDAGPRVATAERTPPQRAARRPVRAPILEQRQAPVENEPQVQTIVLEPDVYTQNAHSNQIFMQTRAGRAQVPQTNPTLPPPQGTRDQQQQANPPPQQASSPQQAMRAPQQQANAPQQATRAPQQAQVQTQAPLATPATTPTQTQTPPRAATPAVTPTPTPQPPPTPAPRRVRRTPPPPPEPVPPVIVTVAPLTWHTIPIAGEPTLVAVRRVVTPDGARTQGLTVGAPQLAEWLDERGDATARLGVDPRGAAVGIGGGPWTITVDDRADVDYALASGAVLRDGFLVQFVPIAALAALCGVLVVLVTARAERLALQRARFAAAAAHELRTPLAGIQLYGDMLGEQLGDPTKQRDYAHRIAVEAARLGRVVTNVLGVSQLERGGLTVRTEIGDVVGAVREAIERSEPGLVRAGAAIELVASAAQPARFDRDAVARIVGNLLDNAEKYGRDATDRTITVTIATVGEHVEIGVRDRGPGLPAALRRGRFQAFSRGAGDDAPPGLGLGLALSQALALAMGGTLLPRAVSPGAELVLRVPVAE